MAVLWDTSEGPVNRVPLLPDDAVFAVAAAGVVDVVAGAAVATLEGTVVLEEAAADAAIVVVSCNCC